MSPLVWSFFIKEAIGMDKDFLKTRRELSMKKPEPFKLPKPKGFGVRTSKGVKGLKAPRLATPRPKLQATKGTVPLSIRTKVKLS